MIFSLVDGSQNGNVLKTNFTVTFKIMFFHRPPTSVVCAAGLEMKDCLSDIARYDCLRESLVTWVLTMFTHKSFDSSDIAII